MNETKKGKIKRKKGKQPRPKVRLTRSTGRNVYVCVNILRAVFFPRGVVNSPFVFVTNENICISGTDGVRELQRAKLS